MKSINVVLRDTAETFLAPVTIGVDYGAYVCVNRKIPMLYAVGDFDSVTKEQYEQIVQSTEVISLPQEKSMTDFEYALSTLHEYDIIYVYGALGGRKDHELLNIRFVENDARIRIVDKEHLIQRLNPGVYEIENEYHYVSFLPIEDAVITLDGFKYPLRKQEISRNDYYLTSNEITGKCATVTLEKGCVLFIGVKKAIL